MSRRSKLFAVGLALGATPLAFALLQLAFVQWNVQLFINNVFLYTLDGYVSHFDHASPTAASANVLAIATSLTGAAALFVYTHSGNIIRSLAVACVISFAMACFASSLGRGRFDYVLTLLTVEMVIVIVLISFFSRPAIKLRDWANFSISDLIALTVVVAFATVYLGSFQSAVLLETSIIYWVFLLGAIVGCLSFVSRRSMYANTTNWVLAAATFIGLTVILATSAFMSNESLRIPNCHYDVEAGAFDGFWYGYTHWFTMHFVAQTLGTIGITKLVKRDASISLTPKVAA